MGNLCEKQIMCLSMLSLREHPRHMWGISVFRRNVFKIPTMGPKMGKIRSNINISTLAEHC